MSPPGLGRMASAAYDRARKIMATRSGAVLRARVLGAYQSVLILCLLGVAGLLGVLVNSRGIAEVPEARLKDLPSWVQNHVTGQRGDLAIVEDSGLSSIVASNIENPHPVHRLGARVALRMLDALPSLRSNLGSIQTLLGLAFALLLLLTLVTRLRWSALAKVSCEVAATLRRQIHRQMYRLGQSSLPTEGTGPVVNLFTREVNDVRDGLFTQLDVGSRVPILVVGLACFLLLVSWVSTLFIIALAGLVWVALHYLRRSNEEMAFRVVRDSALHLSALQEDLGLIRIVRVHGMETVDKARFDEHLDRYTAADIQRIVTRGHGSSVLSLVYGTAVVVGLGLLAATVVLRRESAVSALFLVASLAGLVVPLRDWLRMRRAINQASRSATGIFDYIDRSPELHQAGGAQFLSPLRNRITFENVTLQNTSGRKLLDGLNVEIMAGTRVAVLGLDEDSKYALVCLIPRLIDPKVGRVRVDGIDLRDVTLESIRAQVASVLHADLVFSDTVLANIGLGDPSYDLARIIEAAKLAHAHSFIQNLPEGYETLIGPLGHYLTDDQRYRIGLARAALHDPAIIIIEEPVSIEEDVKPYLDDTITRLAVGRTLIILPHRLSTIRSCDQVIVLQNGRVEASGTPREIHGVSKLYRHIQYMEFNQFATGEVEAGQMNG